MTVYLVCASFAHILDLRGLPPMLVLSGEVEMLRDQIDDFVARGRLAGVSVEDARFPDMIHNWLTLHALTNAIAARIRSHFGIPRESCDSFGPMMPARAPPTSHPDFPLRVDGVVNSRRTLDVNVS